ncbi:MAG: gluconate 2-dehydrogenase subunit 3 family protein [Haloferacaceae archaeon]
MRLTRRDALAALAAAGVAGAGAALHTSGDGRADAGTDGSAGRPDADGAGPVGDRELSTLVAAAEVLYPDAIEGVAAFVERFVRRRAADRPAHAAGVADAVAYLDDYAASWHGERFADLDRATRDRALRAMGADAAEADPEGSDVERVRYYVVNELLFALYATPTGGELVGIENPQGHPGGTASYRRGPGR